MHAGTGLQDGIASLRERFSHNTHPTSQNSHATASTELL
ncbi:hypothetical protein SynRS9907_02479 [Synechococcus sp. RS9907]|nr:hypothetical protein SynRS9907_02479 [Synechococcus sp. RS9907]